ncbi:MAG: type 1 glutamine amidotransferase [Sulfuricellaceae bacterium]|nr:type 1 glutamine amidotransferase [Sulfuricellaceae bacterium]
MKPVAIFRHAGSEGPGYFATYLDEQGIPWQLFKRDEGDLTALNAQDWSGLAFMGGPMSVNDDLPWIAPTLDLIRQAVAENIPVLGHCLGGQLMAKALGGAITRNPVKEIGWGEVSIGSAPQAGNWFGDLTCFTAFHWHGETFSIPPGATNILSSQHCPNQAFTIGNSLAMQCHIEMTDEMIREWCEIGAGEIQAAIDSPGVQSSEDIQRRIQANLGNMQIVARGVYARWVRGLGA